MEGRIISLSSRQLEMLRRTAETLARLGRARADDDRRRGEPPRPGDLYVFRETANFDVEWGVLGHAPQDGRHLLVVPADPDPRVGGADVGVAARASHGALTLRCRFGVRLRRDFFDSGVRTGSLSPEDVARATRKWDEIDRGTLCPSDDEEEVDREPEYQDRIQGGLARARAALAPAHEEDSLSVFIPR